MKRLESHDLHTFPKVEGLPQPRVTDRPQRGHADFDTLAVRIIEAMPRSIPRLTLAVILGRAAQILREAARVGGHSCPGLQSPAKSFEGMRPDRRAKTAADLAEESADDD